MRTIHLHGDLARFGGPFCWDVASPAEAVRGLSRQLPGFRARMSEGSFHVVTGDLDGGFEHEAETLTLTSADGDIHFVPVVEGAGGDGNGFVKAILGTALFAVSILNPVFGAVASVVGKVAAGAILTGVQGLGVSLALSGVSQLLSPTPDLGSNEAPDKRPSFLFNSGINRIEPGNPVPLVFGLFRVGSVVASGGIAVEEVPRSGADGTDSQKFLERTLP